MHSIAAADLSARETFNILTATVVPRPIAWTSTVSACGVNNLAPFSFYTVVSSEPPMLLLSIEPKEGSDPKDSEANIIATGEFVVNAVSVPSAHALHTTSLDHPREVDEFDVAGVTAIPSIRVQPPRIKEALISMECTVRQTLRPGRDLLVIGEVVTFHLAADLVVDSRVDVRRLNPLGRVASQFTELGTLFSPAD
ncbi:MULTISPECIES: flavin reductase family protein [unclassified Rhodococcus (in: high G+C Gram-positive bacteria)]|uniref:flavin reductase family protein n=1 Tax=unclassified Rhodococcus (in: high G+C Gram-positive bacteria) TaxID=192944 RepID=UPI00163B0F04|nr:MULTISPECIES: flavin reductase family protein [unclassified Rhodococcus (in: high G+C Gram-positive bacteria)]MBC2640746.1 flavin reductase family protein [Rhodococcus sp. 3A]MBC2894509.1 flavin reductase family protein [Rhodococcus sp. 4CII]